MKRFLAVVLGVSVSFAGSASLAKEPDVKQSSFAHDDIDYVISYSVQKVKEPKGSANTGHKNNRQEASFIQIARVDGASMEATPTAQVFAIATSYCETHNLALALEPGQVKYLQGSWLVENHCGGMFE